MNPPPPTPPAATVVLVNDDEPQLRILSGYLGRMGLKVRAFQSATAALEEMVRLSPPALIVTDLYMPGIDGWRFCRLLRSPEYRAFNAVPILVVSATYSGEEAARITTDLGANAFLPVPVESQSFSAQVQALLTDQPPRIRPRVLIVEDDADQLFLLQQAFEAESFWVETAPSLAQARASFQRAPCDLVLLDYHLPDGSGDVLISEFRSQRLDCICLMLTGDPSPELALRWMRLGAAAYVRKPFLPRYVVEVCHKARRERSLLRIQDLLEARTRALREREEFARRVLENAPFGAQFYRLEADQSLRLTGYNPAANRALGIEHAPLVGQTLEAALPGLASGELPDRYREIARVGGTFEQEQVLCDPRGVKGTFQISAFQSGPGQMAVFFRDLTQRRQLEERLRQAQKMEAIGQLAGGVAHDFNNILAAIMMNVSLMQQETGLTPILRELLTELEDSAKRAATLTRQLLAFSRRQKMQPQPLELNDLLGNLLKMLRRLLGERINLIFQEATDPPWIEGDPIMMEQVVLNLCVNARDAMPQGGQLILLTRIVEMSAAQMQRHPEAPVGQYVCLTVADTGCGMDAATLEHVFEPFFTTKEVGRGSGLGLATVHGIVEQHHGWLEIESTVGQGTTFRVYLPVSTKAWAGTVEEGAIGWKGGTETILLVEDEISLRRTVALFLRRQGYTVLEAGNGFEALRQWEHHANSIALLFTDMVMPEGMTGLDLARQLRLRRAELPVIVSSGYSPDLISEDQPAQPNLLYLPKPCEPAKLARKLRSLLDQAR